MNRETVQMPSPDDISDEDFKKAVADILKEHEDLGQDIAENFPVSKRTFENWTQNPPKSQVLRKAMVGGMKVWRQKQKGIRD